MSEWEQFASASSATPHQWQAESYEISRPARRVLSAWRVMVLCVGLSVTTGCTLAVWLALRPPTLVQTRITADTSGPAGRAALADAALRIGAMTGQTASLDAFGDALVLTVSDDDPTAARQRARSAADTLLNMSAETRRAQPSSAPIPGLARPDPDARRRSALLADRGRLLAELESADRRLSTVSASLTGVARDIAAGTRASADRKPGHETLDKATVALADLQLQRIQLQTRYQDDYPVVVALDGQIRSLRSFLQDEQHRLDTATRVGTELTDPVLGNERDRLKAELSQLTDRRAAAAIELASVTRALASPLPDHPTPRPEPIPADPSPPAPMLIEGATTVTNGADPRWIAMSAVALVGALLSLLAWAKPNRTDRSVRTEMLLKHLEALMLPSPAATASLPIGRYTALARDQAMILSRAKSPALGAEGM